MEKHSDLKKKTRQHIPHKERSKEYVLKRNKRERDRVGSVNQAFVKLRDHIPFMKNDNRASKIGILKTASQYIKGLTSLLNMNDLCTPITNLQSINRVSVQSHQNDSSRKLSLTSNSYKASMNVSEASDQLKPKVTLSIVACDENLILEWLQRQSQNWENQSS